MWGDDFDDQELARALEESRRHYEEVEQPRLSQIQTTNRTSHKQVENDTSPQPSTSRHPDPVAVPLAWDSFENPSSSNVRRGHGDKKEKERAEKEAELYNGPEAEGFDLVEGREWTYPTNYPVRSYQKHIVEKSLFNNTLVSLPTGLGKTFIAAVVMYNYYKWYPKGKILFMAPTKPLVAQQIENCYNIMGIPQSHTAEMTGAMPSTARAVAWQEKRVFFLTPQVVQNDLSAGICPAKYVKCIVIDEAHKALGDHAYSQVVRMLNSFDAQYRVLALSATPGSDMEAVQKVVTNLMINHIELRNEESPDIVQYTHQRNIETVVVQVGQTIQRVRTKYLTIIGEYARRLLQQKVLFGNVASIAKFVVLKAWEEFRRQPPAGMSPTLVTHLNNDFAVVHSLVHGLELLQTYGMRLLSKHIRGVINGDKGGHDIVGNRLRVNEDLQNLLEEIDLILNPVTLDGDDEEKKQVIYGHPKLDRLQDIVVSHFKTFEEKGTPTRVIIFSEYRDGVIEICEMLKNFEPLVKPVSFMGQATGKNSKGLRQRDQLEVMEKFKKGLYNTLISTSVGEEGLDIGEVDLIVCFDAKNSPIRQVQRCGRTGRKRNGRIIMLITAGKEEQKYKMGLFKKKNVNSALLSKENLAGFLLLECPTMFPPGIHPKCVERCITVVNEKPRTNQQDLRKFLKRSSAGSNKGSNVSPKVRTSEKCPYLTAEDVAELNEWNIEECCKYDKIPERCELWDSSTDDFPIEENVSKNLNLSRYLEHMRLNQRTHLIGHSSGSKLLYDLLSWAEDRRDGVESSQCGVVASKVTSTQLWPKKKAKARSKPPATSAQPENGVKKKRGRPRKNNINVASDVDRPDSPARKEPTLNFLIRPKKPQFIEEDEEGDDNDIRRTTRMQTPPKKNTGNKEKSPVLPTNPVEAVIPPSDDEIIEISDDSNDKLESSTTSDITFFTSQTSRKDLLSSLYTALKKQSPVFEDECDVCATLFPCKSLNALVEQRKSTDKELSWLRVCESLKAATALIPLITKENLKDLTRERVAWSPKDEEFVSLIPRNDVYFEEDFNDGGLLCGGLGDVTQPPLAPENSCDDQLGNNSIACEDNRDDVALSPFISKDKGADPSFRQYLDDDMDFFGLSKIEDVFGTQSSQKIKCSVPIEEKVKCEIREEPKEKSPANQSSSYFKSSCRQEKGIEASTSISCQESPVRENAVEGDSVSPILGSQLQKRSVPFRARKLTQSSQSARVSQRLFPPSPNPSSSFKVDSQGMPRNVTSKNDQVDDTQDSLPVGKKKNNEVLEQQQRRDSPPQADFNLWDDDFFTIKEEEVDLVKPNTTKVDESVKEAIRIKALEAMAKPGRKSLSQKVREMDESSNLGFTQVLDFLNVEVPQGSPEYKLEKADSFSSPSKFTSTAALSDTALANDLNEARLGGSDEDMFHASDEDMFAGCYEEAEGPADSSSAMKEFAAEDCATQSKPYGGACSVSSPMESVCKSTVATEPTSKKITVESKRNVKVEEFDGILSQPNYREESKLPNPSVSEVPVFKKPSKLSLKRRKTDDCESAKVSSSTELEPTPTQKNKKSCLERKQNEFQEEPPIDFSLYDDEFEKSWLCTNPKDPVTKNSGKAESDGNFEITPSMFQNSFSDLCSEDASTKSSVKNDEGSSSLLKTADELQNDFDAAFELLDASRKKKNLSSKSDFGKKSSTFSSSNKLSVSKQVNKAFIPKASTFSSPNKAFLLKPSAASSPNIPTAAKSSSTLSASVAQPYATGKDVVVLLSSDDEEIFPNRVSKKKTNSLNDTTTSEEGNTSFPNEKEEVKSVTNNVTGQKRKRLQMQMSSSTESLEGSGWLCAKKRPSLFSKRPKPVQVDPKPSVMDLSEFCDESLLAPFIDDLDEQKRRYEELTCTKKRSTNSSDEDAFVRDNKKSDPAKKRKKKKTKGQERKKRCAFVESEAEESDDGIRSSSDGENTTLDELDSSFIDDSPPECSQSMQDIQAKYLQSVKSPARAVGAFKIPARPPPVDVNIYSQAVDPYEDQSYANDSFCVDDEPTQYETQDMSLLEIAEAKLKAQRKQKKMLKKLGMCKPAKREEISSSDDEVSILPGPSEKRRLKRIKVLESDSDDNNEGLKSPELRKATVSAQNHIQSPQTQCPLRNQERKCLSEQPQGNTFDLVDDLASLLDDDIDFSDFMAPEDPSNSGPVPGTSYQNSLPSKNSAFVKKTSLFSGPGSSRPSLSNMKPSLEKLSNRQTENTWYEQSKLKRPAPSMAQPINAFKSVDSKLKYMQEDSLQRQNDSKSTVSKLKDAPSPAKGSSHAATGSNTPTVVIVASKQVASSSELIRVMRVTHKVTIIPRSFSNADFIVSWKVGICRVFVSDLRDKKKLEPVVKVLKLFFSKPLLIVEKDRVKSLGPDLKSKGLGRRKGGAVAQTAAPVPAETNHQPFLTSANCTVIALLRQAGVRLLFSQDKEETAGLIANLAQEEKKAGNAIPELPHNLSDEVENRLQFFCSLPGINLALSFKLLHKFPSMSSFFARCSSVQNIAGSLGLDISTARKIHNVLCEVHVTP